MNIDEVHIRHRFDCRDSAIAAHCDGLQCVGTGMFASVWGAEQTPHVVKVMRGRDKGYRAWVETATELGKDNPYVPKISDVHHYRAVDADYAEGEDPGHTSEDVFVFYLERLEESRNSIFPYKHRHVYNFISILNSVIRDMRWDDGARFKKLRPVHQDLIMLLLIARDQCDRGDFDLHTGNVMKRGNRFVVTDPLC